MRKIRLTESDLRRIVNKSVKRALKEDFERDNEIKMKIGNAIGEFEQAVLLLYSLNDDAAQTLASDGMAYLEYLDDYLSYDGDPSDFEYEERYPEFY